MTHTMTYGVFRDSFMTSLVGTLPNGDERKFRTYLIRALSKIINEGKLVLPDVQREQLATGDTAFSLKPYEGTILVARTGSGRKLPIISKTTYDVQYARTYPCQSFYGTGSNMTPYICLVDMGYDMDGNKSYVLPYYQGDSPRDPIKLQLTITQRPPQYAPTDNSYWLDTLPIYPDCPEVIVTVIKSLVQQDAGNTENAISLMNIARHDLEEWMTRENLGTFFGANVVVDSIMQNPITNFM